MTKEELAQQLNGREYGNEITKELKRAAQENGLVVVFGYSDDCIEFRGAMEDEAGCYNGTTIYFTKNCHIIENDHYDVLEQYGFDKQLYEIEAIWNKDGYSWVYETVIPHTVFDILEDGEKYCRGIVFSKYDLN